MRLAVLGWMDPLTSVSRLNLAASHSVGYRKQLQVTCNETCNTSKLLVWMEAIATLLLLSNSSSLAARNQVFAVFVPADSSAHSVTPTVERSRFQICSLRLRISLQIKGEKPTQNDDHGSIDDGNRDGRRALVLVRRCSRRRRWRRAEWCASCIGNTAKPIINRAFAQQIAMEAVSLRLWAHLAWHEQFGASV